MNTVLLTQLKILKMSDIKPNFSELARLYEMDRRTIKKYYEGYEGKPKNRYKTSKLDKYKELIGIKLAIKGVNVRSVYEYLISEIDSDIHVHLPPQIQYHIFLICTLGHTLISISMLKKKV